jgi:hypothetical protein
VTVAAVADHVDDDVLLELLAIVEGDLHDAYGRIGIVAVDVEDGRLHAARNIGGIRRRARFVGQRGEADLVVDDQVNRAAGGVAVELRKIQRLGDHALSGEGRVAVDQHRDDASRAVSPSGPAWDGDAFDDRIHGFEMARIGRDGNHDLAAASKSCARRWRQGDTSRRPTLRAWRVDIPRTR